jgi:hypothetical protein
MLALDTAGQVPSAAVSWGGMVRLGTPGDRKEVAYFVNHLSKLVDLSNPGFSAIIYCEGPGSFSRVRAGVSIVRLLKRAYPELEIRSCTANQLVAHYRRISSGEVCLPAGRHGYFCQDLDGKLELKSELPVTATLLEAPQVPLAEVLLEMDRGNLVRLDDVKPEYGRQANVTSSREWPRKLA